MGFTSIAIGKQNGSPMKSRHAAALALVGCGIIDSENRSDREQRQMVFKITFTDGSVETVHASSAGEARRFAIQQFRERVVLRVQPAGLTDMAMRRPQATDKLPRQGN